MPLSNTYYEALKTQLDTAASSKKAAYDAALLRMTSATFDTEGRLTGYANNAPGSLDIAQMEKTRNIKTGSEQSGMLRSGQYARELATSQAEYRKAITDLAAENEANKGAVDTETATELAKYKAMYGDGTTTSGTGTGATSGSASAAAPSSNPELMDKPPTFSAPTSAASAGNFRMMDQKLSAKPSKPPVGKPIAPKETIAPTRPTTAPVPVVPKPKPVPVSNKIKTLK